MLDRMQKATASLHVLRRRRRLSPALGRSLPRRHAVLRTPLDRVHRGIGRAEQPLRVIRVVREGRHADAHGERLALPIARDGAGGDRLPQPLGDRARGRRVQIAEIKPLFRGGAEVYARTRTFPPSLRPVGRWRQWPRGWAAPQAAGPESGGGRGWRRAAVRSSAGRAGGACPCGDAAPRRRPPVGLLCDDHPVRHRHGSARPAGGPSSPARPRCVRMRRTTRGSSIVAIRRMRPPQFGQARTSTAKTLWSSSAQRQRLGGAALDGGSAGSRVTAPGPEVAKGTPAAAGPAAPRRSTPAGMAAGDVATSVGATIGAASSCVAVVSPRP